MVKRDVDRLYTALKAFPDDDACRKGVELATAIIVAVLHDSYQGKPSPAHIQQATSVFESADEWSGVRPEDVNTYLTVLLDKRSPGEAFDPDMAVLLTFVIAGGLLASSTKVGDDEWWFD
ncbi:MAG: hypothetical protein ACRDT4_17395 [Micromonosporaceae bacterium]